METKVCRGVPLCPNYLDLKWCKNASLWNEPAGWEPLDERFLCRNELQLNGTKHNGQWIKSNEARNGLFYNCLNRMDEDPFVKIKKENATVSSNKKTWLQLVNTPCEKDAFGDPKRRCLGNTPDVCVDPFRCKF